LRRDDFIGLEVCEKLRVIEGLERKVIKCPYGLENCLEEIIRRGIQKLLIVDAALPLKDLGAPVFLTGIDNMSANFMATTHNIPIPMVINYLRMNGAAREAYLLGIAASDLGFGEGLSEEALGNAELALRIILNAWSKCERKLLGKH